VTPAGDLRGGEAVELPEFDVRGDLAPAQHPRRLVLVERLLIAARQPLLGDRGRLGPLLQLELREEVARADHLVDRLGDQLVCQARFQWILSTLYFLSSARERSDVT
jgi:hypothetical protein